MLPLTTSSTSPAPNAEREDIIQLIQKWRLSALAAALLETGGAFATLAAQGLYLAEPLLGGGVALRRFAELLEDPQRSAELAQALREERQ